MEKVELVVKGSQVNATVTFRSASTLHARGTADCAFNGNKKCCNESPFQIAYGSNRVHANYILLSSGDRGTAQLAADLGIPITNMSAVYVSLEFEGCPQCALYNGAGGPDDHAGIAATPFSTSPEFSPPLPKPTTTT